MKFFRYSAATLFFLLLAAGNGWLLGETFYLADQVRVGSTVRVNELLLVPESSDFGDAPLPVTTEGRFVYLSQKGLSRIVPGGIPGALIGDGIWLIPDSFDGMDSAELHLLLWRIASTLGSAEKEGSSGFYFREADLPALSSSGEIRMIRSGARRFLEAEKGSLEPVPVTFLENQSAEAERIPAGTRITVYISRKGLIIEAEGRTNRGAAVGELVPVTLTNTRRRLNCLLTGSGEGEVRL
ncbi:hypothetical protein [Marispirochaeta sp.]|uniref:hypothetical protein n=1 Tax=Marispirochaeta sp. TaxID=2038653 RepID=UPI0029C722C1|nr:hypothetical protein [Marispirochaeta sp.]